MRGAVIVKPERVRPVWLTLQNETDQAIPLAWVSYRIRLHTGLDDDTVIIKADVPIENIPANGKSRVGLLDLDAWNFVKVEVVAVSLDRLPENPPDDTKPEVSLTHQVAPRDLWGSCVLPHRSELYATRPGNI